MFGVKFIYSLFSMVCPCLLGKSLVSKRLQLTSILWVALISSHGLANEITEPEVTPLSDVRLVIDISGSMKKNDPQNLRRPALDMLVQLLPEGSKAGIWTFGQYVNRIVPHEEVNKRWGQKAIGASSSIRSIAQFTNIGEALEQAAYDAKQASTQYQRHVILLTDGMVDIDRDAARNQQERQRIIQEILPLYTQANITLHTIALSDNADQSLLNKLALKTDGKAAVAHTAEELMNVFLQVFDQAVPLEEAIFDGESFVVDSSIEEFTALIFRQPNAKKTEIQSPDGQLYHQESNDPLVSWHHTDQYDMITISQPLEGEWKVSADLESQSRVTVVSDLSIAVTTMPTNIALDETVETTLALKEANTTITRLEFLGLLDIDVAVTGDNDKAWSQRISQNLVPEDGLFPAVLNQFDQEGQYNVVFTVDGKSFKRQYTHQISVRTPFLVEVNPSVGNEKDKFIVTVTPQSNTINRAQTTIEGSLTDPSGKRQLLPFIITEDDAWMLMVNTEEKGEYLLSITVKTASGEPIALETIRLSQSANGNDFAIEEPKENIEPPEEEVTETELVEEADNEGMDIQSMILYGVIVVANILIIGLAYFIYRKFFKKKPENDELGQEQQGAGDEDVDGFVEPPMDDMAVEEIEDDDDPKEPEMAVIDKPADEGEGDDEEKGKEDSDDAETAEEDANAEDDSSDDGGDSALDDGEELDLDDDEDVPDFSLDDFSPDSLDEEDLTGDDGTEEDK